MENELLSKISTLEKNGDGVAVVRQMQTHSDFFQTESHPLQLEPHQKFLQTEPHPNPLLQGEGTSNFSEFPHEGSCNCEKKNWILVLDGIRDPGNMGTILRTAAWFGITKILCSPDCVEIYNPKVVSATMGAIFHVDVSYSELETFYKNNTHLPIF